MEYIWAPWRLEFIQSEKPKGCILCDKPKQNKDAENYIIYRGQLNFVMLNAYPYNPGHLMVAPYRHIDSIEGMTDDELHEHFEIVRRSTGILRDVYCPGGFNLGLNLGRVAGVGIADHIHTHIVPRWQGDSNFMPVIAETKVLPEALSLTYQKLLGKF
jgi:ATP adenylyltransferase